MTWGSTEPPSASMVAPAPAWLTASEFRDTEASLAVKVDTDSDAWLHKGSDQLFRWTASVTC